MQKLVKLLGIMCALVALYFLYQTRPVIEIIGVSVIAILITMLINKFLLKMPKTEQKTQSKEQKTESDASKTSSAPSDLKPKSETTTPTGYEPESNPELSPVDFAPPMAGVKTWTVNTPTLNTNTGDYQLLASSPTKVVLKAGYNEHVKPANTDRANKTLMPARFK
jgi:cytoskeletal protein RodZ